MRQGLFAVALTMVSVALVGSALARRPAVPAPQPQGPAATGAQAAGAQAKPLIAQSAMLEPIQVQSLSLTPIVATPPANGAATPAAKDDDLLVLDEAMAQKKVKIHELGDGSVNQLSFSNTADKPVFVMAGEVILGGKQDRIIGRNTVIPAKTTLEVPVFCVEHGRWDGKNKEFASAKALAHGRLRGQASYEAQQDVWNEVAAKNKARKTENASDTYRRVAQQQSDGTLAGMEKQVQAALAKVPEADRARMVGYAVALNGAVATVDVFGSPALFKKLEAKLVRSYLTEAIDVAVKKDAKPPTSAQIQTFVADADKEQERPSYDTAASSTAVKRGMHASKAKVQYKPAARGEAPPAVAAEPAKPLYENYQSK